MKRHVEPEIIDDPSTPTPKLERLLRSIRTTNERMGGIAALLDHLKAWSPQWPRDREVTLLDIGTGSGDLPLAAARWAWDAGLRLRVVGIDANTRAIDMARRLCGDAPGVEFQRCDAADLLDERTSPFDADSFDYVHAGLFIHHLNDALVPRMLAAMNRIGRAGIVWNDLIRSRRGVAVAWLATIGRPIRHDCLASLRAGFRKEEVLELAQRVGLDYVTHQERYLFQRFTLAGQKPGAWSLPRSQPMMVVAARAS